MNNFIFSHGIMRTVGEPEGRLYGSVSMDCLNLFRINLRV